MNARGAAVVWRRVSECDCAAGVAVWGHPNRDQGYLHYRGAVPSELTLWIGKKSELHPNVTFPIIRGPTRPPVSFPKIRTIYLYGTVASSNPVVPHPPRKCQQQVLNPRLTILRI